ncbi:ribonuclease III [Chelatococcus asaccharovorans]|nr:ribonuclease III [Chelatococcus asaccharovorans]MBS7703870.1 ribonuclease III [Chelatococcus asaccharovorans]
MKRGTSNQAGMQAAIEDRIGYRFRDRDLLMQALTHISAVPSDKAQTYQRLEFLGDRVLGLAVSDMLFRAFPDAEEGELSRRLAELVRRESCAEVAAAWGVGDHVRLGDGEIAAGARENAAILADICEAIVGAAFVDGGTAAAQGIVERAFRERLHAPRRPLRDAKTALQEWAQGRGLPTPAYTVAHRSGPDHAPHFRIAVAVRGMTPAEGAGTSKRVAEQAAAREFLVREQIWTADGN